VQPDVRVPACPATTAERTASNLCSASSSPSRLRPDFDPRRLGQDRVARCGATGGPAVSVTFSKHFTGVPPDRAPGHRHFPDARLPKGRRRTPPL
jgi:hypothetical protein